MAYLLVLITDEEELVPDILDAWEEAGVPAVTTVDTRGSKHKHLQTRDDLPFVVSLRAVLESQETHTRTLLSVIEDEAVVQGAAGAVLKIIPDFPRGHRGVMFTMPLALVWGSTNQPEHEAK